MARPKKAKITNRGVWDSFVEECKSHTLDANGNPTTNYKYPLLNQLGFIVRLEEITSDGFNFYVEITNTRLLFQDKIDDILKLVKLVLEEVASNHALTCNITIDKDYAQIHYSEKSISRYCKEFDYPPDSACGLAYKLVCVIY